MNIVKRSSVKSQSVDSILSVQKEALPMKVTTTMQSMQPRRKRGQQRAGMERKIYRTEQWKTQPKEKRCSG